MFISVSFSVANVTDYTVIYVELQRSLVLIKGKTASLPRAWPLRLDSGTPQTKTALFLAAHSSLFLATLNQGITPRFAGGSYKCREVSLEGMLKTRLPESKDSDCEVQPIGRSAPAMREQAADGAASPATTALVEPIAVSLAFSEVLRYTYNRISYEEPVLLLGEIGTGKAMGAGCIHEKGRRSKVPLSSSKPRPYSRAWSRASLSVIKRLPSLART